MDKELYREADKRELTKSISRLVGKLFSEKLKILVSSNVGHS